MKFRALQGRRDSNHGSVKEALDDNRIPYVEFPIGGGVTDLITHARDNVFMEIKSGSTDKSRLKLLQLKFIVTWPGFTGVVEGPRQAIALATHPSIWAFDVKQKIVMLKYVDELEARAAAGAKKDSLQVQWSTIKKAFLAAGCEYKLANIIEK